MPKATKKKFDFGKLFGNATPEERRRMQTQMKKWGGGNMDNLRGRTPTAGIAGDTTKAVQPLGSPTSTKGAIRRVSPGRQPVRSSDTTKEGKKKMTRHHQATFTFEDRLIEAILSNPNTFVMITEGRNAPFTRGADKWKRRGMIAALVAGGALAGYKGTKAVMGGGKKKPQDTHQVQQSTQERPVAPTVQKKNKNQGHEGRGVSADEDEIGDSSKDYKGKYDPKLKGPSGKTGPHPKSLGKGRVTQDSGL